MKKLIVPLIFLLPSICWAYSPSPSIVLSRMNSLWRQADSVEVQLQLENRRGKLLEEKLQTVPSDGQIGTSVVKNGISFRIPFALLTAPRDSYLDILSPLYHEDAKTTLTRIGSAVCYLLEGPGSRLWIRKADLIPLKVEIMEIDGGWTTYLYLDLVPLSENMVFPSRTEVHHNGKIIFIENMTTSPLDIQ